MSEFRLSPEAEAELDGIWLHIARASGSAETATRVVESIAERFWLLAQYPDITWDGGVAMTCVLACAVSPPTNTSSSTEL